MHLNWIDYLIMAIYFAFVLGIGAVLKRRMKSSDDFFSSGHDIPLWIASLAFISANLGAQEVIGMAASGAKYGIMTAHFYWVGAIPAMVFLGLFMMPFYYGSRARSVPEYLRLRFDEKTRTLNAVSFLVMTVFSSGISLYALAILLQLLLHWNFEVSLILTAGMVLSYTLMGGLTSAIYNEVLQFFLIVLGISPLVYAGLRKTDGWSGIKASLPEVMTHTWHNLGSPAQNPMGVSLLSLLMGLGFVLSFGYWCTDFLVVQRAMVARDMSSARKTPIYAAIPKLLMPLVVVLPGLIAAALAAKHAGGLTMPLKADGRIDYDMTLPTLLTTFYPNGLLGVGLTALMASFMSGMAGNVTAFNAVWTYDIYQTHIRPKADDAHYLHVGRMTTIIGILGSCGIAYLARSFNNIMDLLQLVFGFVNAPLFATFLLGMGWKRTTGHGAFWGLIAGTTAAAITHGTTVAEGQGGWLGTALYTFPSSMGQAFAIAISAWSTCFIATIAISLVTKPRPDEELRGLVYGLTKHDAVVEANWYQRPWALATFVLVSAFAINFALG